MNPLPLILLVTFLESLATVMVERGVYFFTREQLDFNNAANLWLALGSGVVYVVGAMGSHRAAARFGERRLLLASVIAQVLLHAIMALQPDAVVIVASKLALSLCAGAKWPVIESYVSAGQSSRDTPRALGKFNLSWAVTVPLGLVLAGPILASWPRGLFVFAGMANLASLVLIARGIAPTPSHLPHDHPDHLPPSQARRLGSLMRASRASMLLSYILLFLLVPLMPAIFTDRLRIPLWLAPCAAASLDLCRLAALTLLFVWPGWHGRSGLLVLVAAGLPAGFFMVLLGNTLPVVTAGALVFGLAAGLAYFSALYYAMVVKRASVDAGGGHESLIGVGFAIGPLAGLLGQALAQPMGGSMRGMVAVTGPMVLLCIALSLREILLAPPPDLAVASDR